MLNVVVQLGSKRFIIQGNLLRSIYVGFSIGFTFLIGGEYVLAARDSDFTADSVGYWIANSLLYGALGYGYFHFINLGETGRRVRIMWELSEAPAGYTERELLERYGSGEITRIRLGRLVRSRQIVMENGRYRILSPVVLTMARTMIFLKVLLLKKSSEYE